MTISFPYSPAPSGQRGWICPICGAGVSPSIMQHCGSSVGTVKVVPATNPNWCTSCGQYIYGHTHFCPGKNWNSKAVYETNTSTAGTATCVNNCDSDNGDGCSDCP